MREEEIVKSCCDYIEQNLSSEICMDWLASFSGYSFRHLERIFQQKMGLSISEYIRKRRVDEGLYRILHGVLVEQAAKELGYAGSYTFARAVSGEYGCSPLKFIKKLSNSPGDMLEGIEIRRWPSFPIYYPRGKSQNTYRSIPFVDCRRIAYWKWGQAEKGQMEGQIGYFTKTCIPKARWEEKWIAGSLYAIFPVVFEVELEKLVESIVFHDFWRILAEGWLLKSKYTFNWMGDVFVFSTRKRREGAYVENRYLNIPVKERKGDFQQKNKHLTT